MLNYPIIGQINTILEGYRKMANAEEKKLLKSDQCKQWIRLGLGEIFKDEGETFFRWTKKADQIIPYSERRLVQDMVMGRSLYDWIDRKSWKYFDEFGFAKENQS